MRNILMLLIGILGLALVRNLLKEVTRFAARAMGGGNGGASQAGSAKSAKAPTGGTLVCDPHTGTYVDPKHAVRSKVGGKVHYFESEASRDAYVKAQG